MLQEMMEREETASSFGVARVGTSWDDALGGQEGVPPNIITFLYFKVFTSALYDVVSFYPFMGVC